VNHVESLKTTYRHAYSSFTPRLSPSYGFVSRAQRFSSIVSTGDG